MIDLNITINDALKLLKEKMKHELHFEQKKGRIPSELVLENVSNIELISLLESSIFDLLLLLPVDFIINDTNIAKFVESTVHALAKNINRQELFLYNAEQVKKILIPLITNLKSQTENLQFLKN